MQLLCGCCQPSCVWMVASTAPEMLWQHGRACLLSAQGRAGGAASRVPLVSAPGKVQQQRSCHTASYLLHAGSCGSAGHTLSGTLWQQQATHLVWNIVAAAGLFGWFMLATGLFS